MAPNKWMALELILSVVLYVYGHWIVATILLLDVL